MTQEKQSEAIDAHIEEVWEDSQGESDQKKEYALWLESALRQSENFKKPEALDRVSMALEGLAVSQAEGKQLLERALELGAATGKDSLKYAEELRRRLTEATNTANELLKEQVALFNELPKDRVAATQKALELGAEAVKAYVTLVNDFWSRLEKVSHQSLENYIGFFSKLHAMAVLEERTSGRERSTLARLVGLATDPKDRTANLAEDLKDRVEVVLEEGKEIFGEKKTILSAAYQAGKEAMERERTREKQEKLKELSTTEVEGEEATLALPGWTRSDRMVAILLREEAVDFIEALERQDSPDSNAVSLLPRFLLESQENLHTLADLVSEDLVSVSKGQLVLTPLAERLIDRIARLE